MNFSTGHPELAEREAAEDHAFATAWAEGDQRVLAACRSAFRWGHSVGWHAGYGRSFALAPRRFLTWEHWITDEQLQRRRGEHPDQDPPGAPRPDDYTGGPVPSW